MTIDFERLRSRARAIDEAIEATGSAQKRGEDVEACLDCIAEDCDELADRAHAAADALRAAKGDPPGWDRQTRVRQPQREPLSRHEMRQLDGLKLGPTPWTGGER